ASWHAYLERVSVLGLVRAEATQRQLPADRHPDPGGLKKTYRRQHVVKNLARLRDDCLVTGEDKEIHDGLLRRINHQSHLIPLLRCLEFTPGPTVGELGTLETVNGDRLNEVGGRPILFLRKTLKTLDDFVLLPMIEIVRVELLRTGTLLVEFPQILLAK